MKKTNENAPERGVESPQSQYDDLGICCPPMSKSLLKDLIDPRPYDDVDDDYQLVFESTPFFESLTQSYLDYIHRIYPCITKLVFHWDLLEKGTGPAPSGRTRLEQTWNWFEPFGEGGGIGGGNIYGDINFFSEGLVENTWYTVDLGIYTEGCDAFKGKNCIADYSFDYRWQLT